MSSPAHVTAIQTIRRRAGINDGDYKALLFKETGKRSSKALSNVEAERFISVLRGFGGGPARQPRADRATGKYARLLQALWISGYHLCLIDNKTDAAMMAFVERQTGASHTRFLSDHFTANRAVAALQKWLERGGVQWPPERDGEDAILARKRAVCHAIATRLVAAGGFSPMGGRSDWWPGDIQAYGYGGRPKLPALFSAYTPADWDQLIARLGARLRDTLASNAKDQAHG